MKKIDVGQSVGVLANVAILVGLILVAIELNQNTQQLTLELAWQANQKYFENNRDVMGGNPTPVFAKAVTNPTDITFEEFQVASAFILNWINVWEDKYFMYDAGLIPDQEWKSFIADDVDWTLGNEFAQAVWRTHKSYFEAELVEYVDELLPSVSTSATFALWNDTMEPLYDSPRVNQ